MNEPYLIKKEPGRKYCQYILAPEFRGAGDTDKWRSIKKLLPPEKQKIAGDKEKCGAWLYKFCTERSLRAEYKEREAIRQEAVRAGEVPTFGEFVQDWYVIGKCQWLKIREGKGHSYKEQTIKSKRARLEKYVIKVIGSKPLNEVSFEDIELLCANSGRSPQTQLHIIDDLRPIFKHARKKKLITDNPIDLLELEKFENQHKDIMTDPELQSFFPNDTQELERVHGEYWRGVFWFVSMIAKNRISETVALQWQDFAAWQHPDFGLVGALRVNRHVDCDNEVSTGTKTGKQAEFIIIPLRGINLLQEWHRRTPYKEPGDFIFFGKDKSKPINKDSIRKWFYRALDNAGIERSGRNLTPHSLRYLGVTKYSGSLSEQLNRTMKGHKTREIEAIYDKKTAEEKVLAQITADDLRKINKLWE